MADLANALNEQGVVLLSQHLGQSADFFREAIQVDPEFPDAHTNLGVALFMGGNFRAALSSLEKSNQLRPDHNETLLNLGYARWRLNDLEGAVEAFKKVLDLSGMTQAHIALGGLYWELGDNTKAEYHSVLGITEDPNNLFANETLRELYCYSGQLNKALMQCDKMMDIAPRSIFHPIKKALVKLTYDSTDWEDHECRLEDNCSEDKLSVAMRTDPRFFAKTFGKKWDGRKTGHLLLHREQGFGDNIQSLRFVPEVASRCEKLSFTLPIGLHDLAKMSLSQCDNIEYLDRIPKDFDQYCHIMSLPLILGNIPTDPYIVAPKDRFMNIRALERKKVGLCWAGNAKHPEERWRSIPFSKIRPLLSCDMNFVSLQLDTKDDLSGMHVPLKKPTHMNGSAVGSWKDTAALIDALDLLITVDTAVAHLAGAMGKPVWLLNRYNTDWRWMLERTDSYWYPSMRIFRQPKMGDWDSVIENAKMELNNGNI